jgi:MFS family permease
MLSDYKRVVNNKNFVLLWTSQILSQLTIHVINFTLLIKLFAITGSTIATSMLWVSYAIPTALIGPIASATIDFVDRKKVLMITNFAQALTIFLYVFLHEEYLFLLYGIAMIYSFLNQFYIPAEFASLPSLVKKNNYPFANSLFFLTQQSSIILGFGLAGVFNQLLGFSNTLLLASILLFMAFISVSFLPKLKVRTLKINKAEDIFINFFRQLFEGYQLLRKRKDILIPFFLIIVFQVGAAIIMVNVPIIAKDILGVQIEAAGYNVVVPAGLGAAYGAIMIPKLMKRKVRKKKIIEMFLLIMSVDVLLIAFLLPELFSIVKQMFGLTFIFISGVSFLGVLIPSQTYLQEATPPGYRGRVFGNIWFFVTLATIFPVIFSGALTEIFGIKFLFLLMFMVTISMLVVSKKYGAKLIQSNSNNI